MFHFESPDWHSAHIRKWERWLAPWAGVEGVRYLEIGTHEGRSALWIAENVCTSASSRLYVVDVWRDPKAERTFDANLAASGASERVVKLKGRSVEVLGGLVASRAFRADVAYVDGSHEGIDCLTDAVLAWELLVPGGLLIFDDYLWTGERRVPPGPAVDGFLACAGPWIDWQEVGYQVAVRKGG